MSELRQSTKATGEIVARPTGSSASTQREEKAGFYVRGAYIGALRHGHEIVLAEDYHRIVNSDPNAHMVETWALPESGGRHPAERAPSKRSSQRPGSRPGARRGSSSRPP